MSHKRLRLSVEIVVGDEGGVLLFVMQIKSKTPVFVLHFDKMSVQIVKNLLLARIFREILSILRRRDSMLFGKCPAESRGGVEARCR